MGFGDYNHFTRRWYADKSLDRNIAVGDGTAQLAAVLAPKNAGYQLWIQKITVSPTTYAAKTLTFQDTAGTPFVIGLISIPAAAPTTSGFQPYILDFGPKGIALTAGKSLDIVLVAGLVASLHIEAYERTANAVINFNTIPDINGNVGSNVKTSQ